MNRILLPCLLALTACSAEVFVETEPFNQSVPVTSILEPVYAEVAIDVPPEAQGLDIIVREIAANLTVVNPTRALTLRAGARLLLEGGQATPETPVFYTDNNRPAYFDRASVVLQTETFAPQQRRDVTIGDSPEENRVLVQAAGKPRIWLIVNNTVERLGVGTDTLPVTILLENIVFSAHVTKPFPGVSGGMEVGGL